MAAGLYHKPTAWKACMHAVQLGFESPHSIYVALSITGIYMQALKLKMYVELKLSII